MPPTFLPNPLCAILRAIKIDSGTLCCRPSPTPGIVGTTKTSQQKEETAVVPPPASEMKILPLKTKVTDFRVEAGQVTFDAEGNDDAASLYFSRAVHWPGNDLSGVTIGRGYDLGNRLEAVVYTDLIDAGVDSVRAKNIAKGAKLKGNLAADFVKKNKKIIGEISHLQQVRLFELIYPSYVQRARVNYDSWTSSEQNRVPWDNLLPKIRDIMVDFVYQGFTKGPNPMKAGMTNDVKTLIQYIEDTPVIKMYENGRKRAAYLRT